MTNKPKLSLKKKLLFSGFTCVSFFLVLELLLRLFTVQPSRYRVDPYVGFSNSSPLFVAANDGDVAEMVTAANKLVYFNEQRFLKDKPDHTYRIFCLGGSTTYGRPYDQRTAYARWLSEFLNRADPSRNWEVINVGGISYASYRIASVMEELNQYAPDLYIVYTGHNEFLERRTYGSAQAVEQNIGGLKKLLSRTRTYTLAEHYAQQWSGQQLRQLEQRDLLPDEVDEILDQSVGPAAYTRDEPLKRDILKHFEFNLRRMNYLAEQAGAELVFITPALNLRDFSPFKSEHGADLSDEERRQWQSHVDAADRAALAGESEVAAEAIEKALVIDDRYADLHYRYGRALDALGRFDAALLAYQRAVDEDICPLRASGPLQAAVRKVAEESSAGLVDFTQKSHEWANDGLPGNDLFLDHVHPTIDAHRRLALELFRYLEESGIVSPNTDWSERAAQAIEWEIEGEIDTAEQGKALRNVAQILAWAGKINEATEISRRAVKLAGDDAHTNFIAGHLLYRSGAYAQAIDYLQKTIRLDPQHFLARLDLGEIYFEQGEFAQARIVSQEAAQLDPKRPEPQILLEKIESATHGPSTE